MKRISKLLVAVLLINVIFGGLVVIADDETEIYEKIAQMVNDNWDDNYISEMKLTIGEDTMVVDGEEKQIDESTDTVPVVINDRTMLPIRVIVEEMGGEVDWNGKKKSISIAKEDTNIELELESSVMKVNDNEVELDSEPIVINDRTFLPVRAVTEALGCECEWDGDAQTVTITNEFQTKRLIVKTKKDVDFDDYDAVDSVEMGEDTYLVQFSTVEAAKAACEELEEICEYAVPDAIAVTNSAFDDYYSWGVEFLKADRYAEYADEVGYGSATVAVIDSGIDKSHELFDGRLASGGYNFVSASTNVTDKMGHGTHVSGIIADCTNGLDVRILPLKVFRDDTEKAPSSCVISAINYAVKKGADVINLSLGSKMGSSYPPYDEAVENAVDNGVTVTISAGNDSCDTKYVRPASINIKGAIVVAACNEDGEAAEFSNYGDSVDVAAPGYKIKSSVPEDDYGIKSGTSMAAPHIAAMVAMMKLANPSCTPKDIENALKNSSSQECEPYKARGNYGIIPNMKNLINKTIASKPEKTSVPTEEPKATEKPVETKEPVETKVPISTKDPKKTYPTNGDEINFPDLSGLELLDSGSIEGYDDFGDACGVRWEFYENGYLVVYPIIENGQAKELVFPELWERKYSNEVTTIIFEEGIGTAYIADETIDGEDIVRYLELDSVKDVYSKSDSSWRHETRKMDKIRNIYSVGTRWYSRDGVQFKKETDEEYLSNYPKGDTNEFLISYPKGRTETTYTIPDTTEFINGQAFYGCKLEKIIVPENVLYIKFHAFQECKKLKDLYIYNPELEFDDMVKRKGGIFGEAEDFERVTLHGYRGSTAEAYAEKMGMNFEEID